MPSLLFGAGFFLSTKLCFSTIVSKNPASYSCFSTSNFLHQIDGQEFHLNKLLFLGRILTNIKNLKLRRTSLFGEHNIHSIRVITSIHDAVTKYEITIFIDEWFELSLFPSAGAWKRLVKHIHLQRCIVGNVGLSEGVPWLNADRTNCYLCKEYIEDDLHFLLDCSFFLCENFHLCGQVFSNKL